MRPTGHIDAGSSLRAAATRLSESGGDLLPVVDGPMLVGAVTQRGVLDAIAGGAGPNSSVAAVVDETPPTIFGHSTCAEALRSFESFGVSTLVVVDEQNRLTGILSPADLLSNRIQVRLPPAGGMATPFGVYLTNGVVTAGPGHFALMCTGAILFTLVAAATVLSELALSNTQLARLSGPWADIVQAALIYVLFAIGFRAMPLTGTHAAEHMVVHAMERGEELTLANVRRMPRVHPRCGTNLAVGATIFVTIAETPWMPYVAVRNLIALVAAVTLWRRVGSVVQYYVTTRPPTDRQIQMGIRSAKSLVERYLSARRSRASLGARLLRSGLAEVYFGSFVAAAILHAVFSLAGYPDLL